MQLFAEEISANAGLFQSLDARVKVISTLALLISVSFSRSLLGDCLHLSFDF